LHVQGPRSVLGQAEQLLRLRHRLRSEQPSDFELRSHAEMLETQRFE